MTQTKRVLFRHRFGNLFALAVLAAAACFHGPEVASTASLGPEGPDSGQVRTRGPFAVVYAAPRGEVADRKQPGVTIMFSRAMRTVETPDGEGVPAISIQTANGPVAGRWRWTGTRGLLFSPAADLPGGSDFLVTVPAGTKSEDGAVLERPYTLEFRTRGPTVLGMSAEGQPGSGEQALPADARIRVDLDQPVAPADLEAASILHVKGPDGAAGEDLHVRATMAPPSLLAKQAHGASLYLTAEKPLPLDRSLELSISPQLRGTGGPRPMGAAASHKMRTHGPLRLVDFYCPRITRDGRCRAGGDIKLTFSTPVDSNELPAYLHGLPPARKPNAKERRHVGAQTSQWLWVAPEMGAEYTIGVRAGLRDIYGQKLASDVSFKVAVESPLVRPPSVIAPPAPTPLTYPNVRPPLPAAAPNDARPRRERLPYRLELGVTGQVLEANGPHKVAVGAINIPSYMSMAAALTEEQAASFTLAHDRDFLVRNSLVPNWIATSADVNERAVDFLDLDAALARQHGRGASLLAVRSPGGETETETLITLTDLGVTAKMGPYGGLVWVTQLSSGKPVANATVAIRTAQEGVVFQGTTDHDGLLTVPVERFDATVTGKSDLNSVSIRNDAVIVVHSGDDWTMTKIERAQADARLTPEFSSLSKLGQWAGMIFADRGVFRPGESAKVSGIVRVAGPTGLRSVPGRELRIELRDRNSEQIFDGRATCDEFGTFALDVPVPKNAELGPATLTATAAAGGRSNTFLPGVFSHPIRILAYTPDEFKVATAADKPSYVRGDTAIFTTTGEYLYGAPMPGAGVTSTVTRQEVPFEPPGLDGFTTNDDVNTGDVPETTKAAEAADSEDGKLDEQGRFVRRVELAFEDQRRPERISFDAEVQDISRRTVSSRTGVVLHPAEFYVALRNPADRFAAAGAPYHAEVLTVEPSGTHRAGAKVSVDLVERKWNTVVGEQPDGTKTRRSEPVDTVLSSCTVVSADKPAGCDVHFPRAGYFVLRATATDARGNTVRASTGLYGTEASPTGPSSWGADDRGALKLEANKKTYEPGETAKVVLRNPFGEGEALVTVERNGVLYQSVVPIRGPLPVLSIPIAPDFYPNAFLSVVAVRGRIRPAPATGADLGAPEFRLGYLELNVNPEPHRLHVAITEPKSEYQPGDMVDADVAVTDAAGRPATSALTFYVVDEGVLALTSYKTPDPLPAFVTARKLAVFAVESREALARLIQLRAGERFPSLGFEYALAPGSAYDKGHAPGDGDGAKRANFRTTAYFEAGRKTDDHGKAHFRFKLPDNLTTFRVMAVAAGADDRFGSGDSKVTTFRELMARPALPRVVRVGDALEASVIVASKPDPDSKGAGAPMNVEVKLDVKGLDLRGANTRSITMPRGGQSEVRFPLDAKSAGEAVLAFTVRSGKNEDRVEVKRKVTLSTSPESAAVYGETDGTASIALGDTRLMRPERGGLDIHMAGTALVGLSTALDTLLDYPYACTEQLSSRMLPLLTAEDLAKAFGRGASSDTAAILDAAIENILKRQNSDGGFGYWDGSPSEPWLSAYAMFALGSAVEKKRFVPADMIESGRSYLTAHLASYARSLGPKTDDDGAPLPVDAGGSLKRSADQENEFASATLIADVLATLGWGKPAALNVLFDARAGYRLFGQAALLHAMAKSGTNEAEQKTLAHEIESRLRVGANDVVVDEADSDAYGGTLDSNARTLAMALRAFLAASPHHPLAARMARGLVSLRKNGAWRTTQEDAWALLALGDYRKTEEAGAGELSAHAYLRGSHVLDKVFAKGSSDEAHLLVPASRIAGEAGGALAFEASGRGTLFYAAELKYDTTALPSKPRDEGLFVQKYVRGVAPSALSSVIHSIPERTADTVSAGDLVVVDLLFETAEPRDQVVLDDPLPSGLEALDLSIDTTSQARRDETDQQEERGGTWLGTTYRTATSRREVRDDRVLTFFGHVEPGMYRVTYLARATSVGKFVEPPTRIEAMYVPEVYGRTAAGTLSVTPNGT